RGFPDIRLMKTAKALLVVLAVACAPELLARSGGDDCLVTSEAGPLADGVLAIEPRPADGTGRGGIACRAGAVSAVRIRLAPGDSAQARILLIGDQGADREHAAALAAGSDQPLPWWRLSTRRIDARTLLVTLSIAAPAGIE